MPFLGFRCSLCGEEYGPLAYTSTCPRDGGNLDVILDVERIRGECSPTDITGRAELSLWRYLPLLPVSAPAGRGTPLHAAGWTPIFQPGLLARQLNLRRLWVKDDGRNPTASFKDRASAVVVVFPLVPVTAITGIRAFSPGANR